MEVCFEWFLSIYVWYDLFYVKENNLFVYISNVHVADIEMNIIWPLIKVDLSLSKSILYLLILWKINI
jgi:hypothetical protein